MALSAKVKVSDVKDLSNARYCAGMGVDYLGFNVDFMPQAQFTEIRNWLTGVQIVAETSKTNPEEISKIIQTYNPDFIQLYSTETSELPALFPNKILENSLLISYEQYHTLADTDKNKYIIDIPSSHEIRPGVSNFDGLMDKLEALEAS